MGSCQRFIKGWDAVSISQPKVFHRYNMGMGGVDKMDQLVVFLFSAEILQHHTLKRMVPHL